MLCLCNTPSVMTCGDRDKLMSLSHRLHDVMEEIGVSEDMRTLYRESTLVHDIGITLFVTDLMNQGKGWKIHTCGSSFEGSQVPCSPSDVDVVICEMDYKVILKKQNPYKILHFLVIEDTDTYPGYVKLQWVINGQPQTIANTDGQRGLRFLTPTGIINMCDVIDCSGKQCLKPFLGPNKHGPANSVTDKNGMHIADDTVALFCKDIPDHSSGWIRRKRQFGWPTDKQIKRMRAMGCFFVGVGHEDSAEAGLEWRISFTLQERLLMSSLNPCQHKTYVLLKIIRKDLLEPVFGDNIISSYHLKTCILHVAENTCAAVWTEQNLVKCVLHCLHIVYIWAHNRYCPNYFVKDQNLFKKVAFRRKRCLLLQELKRLLGLKYELVHILRTNGIGIMLTDEGRDLFCKVIRYKKALCKLSLILAPTNPYAQVSISYFQNINAQQHHPHDLEYIRRIKSMPEFYDYKDDVQRYISNIIPWNHLSIGKQLASDSLMKVPYASRCLLLQKAFEHLRLAFPTDLVQVDFAKASYYCMKRRYQECLKILERIEKHMTTKAVSMCTCSSLTLTGKHSNRLLRNIDTLDRKTIFNQLARCVFFSPSHKFITPHPLNWEMKAPLGEKLRPPFYASKCYFAVIDANVYLYFLTYLVNDALKRRGQQLMALLALQHAVKHDKSEHQDTAYNLLGWVYIQEDRIGDAILCFMLSWEILPFYNAAKFHMKQLKDILLRICHCWLNSMAVRVLNVYYGHRLL